MKFFRSLASALSVLATLAAAQSSTGGSVLVVIEEGLHKEDFSIFFDGLEERGYSLTFREPSASEPAVLEFDVPKFSHIIFFTPTAKTYAADLSAQSLLGLLHQQVNLLIALSPSPTPLTSFAPEFGLIPPPPHTPLFSHFPARKGPKTIVPVHPWSGETGQSAHGPFSVLFEGIPVGLSPNPLIYPILSAPPESFATDTTKDSEASAVVEAAERGGEGLWAGSSMSLVTGFQTKSNGRVVWAGGVQMFSDAFTNWAVVEGTEESKKTETGNKAFVQNVAAWVFQESGVYRVESVSHAKEGESEPRETYTTNDRVTYSIAISRFNPPTDSWVPAESIDDLQLEFTMLDPHIRTSLPPKPGHPGVYETSFRVPDRHGVFKFIVDWRRKGSTYLYSATTVPVVPPRHDGYPRFLSAAWPYYAGALSTSVAFVLFSALWLGGAATESGNGVKKGKTE